MIRTLITDDSPLVRAIIRDFLESDGSFQVVAEAENGQDGVNKARQLKPDLITMDIEMPVMNGLEAIAEITKDVTAAIVVITTIDTAKMAFDATVKGAHDFFAKDNFTQDMSSEKREHIINTLKQITEREKFLQTIKDENDINMPLENNVKPRSIEAIVIASSTGGPQALSQLCTSFTEDFPVPIILVQHNTSGFDLGLAQWLNGLTPLNVCIAEEKKVPVKGNIYIAPTDKHLLLEKTGFTFCNNDPVNNQKPAADLLFKSAAEIYGGSLVSVVLTGMGSDGADGTRSVKEAGGITIAQDEATSMIYGMPQAAFETGCVDMVLPLEEIAGMLINFTRRQADVSSN